MQVFELFYHPDQYTDERVTLSMFQSMESAAKFFGCDPGEFSPVGISTDGCWERKPTANEWPSILHHYLYIVRHEVKP